VPNTTIDYVIPQTTDNCFYLEHDLRGRRYAPGWVWLCAYAGIAVSEDDRVITLSTCDNVHIDYRIAVHGRLISETFPHLEDNEINT